MVLPVYFYLQLRNPPQEQWIQLWNAKPLPLSIILGSLLPGIAELTAPLFPRSSARHQQIIALIQVSPLIVATIQTVASNLYPIRNIDVRTRKSAFMPSVRQALFIAGSFSALCHLTILVHILFGWQTFSSIYVPGSSSAVASAGTSKILEGSRLFLQYDYLGITLSTLLWVYYLVVGLSDVSRTYLVSIMLIGNILIGPGAVTSAVLWWRECRFLELMLQAKKAKIPRVLARGVERIPTGI